MQYACIYHFIILLRSRNNGFDNPLSVLTFPFPGSIERLGSFLECEAVGDKVELWSRKRSGILLPMRNERLHVNLALSDQCNGQGVITRL